MDNQLSEDKMRMLQENKIINKFFYGIQELMEYLHGRWCDEYEYEDINDYGIPIIKKLPEEIKFLKMTKRPFGFRFVIGKRIFQIAMTGNSYTCKLVKMNV